MIATTRRPAWCAGTVVVRDSGTGIDVAIRLLIFEPLFTINSTGTGMGLSICHSIIEVHRVHLRASQITAPRY
jgi:signal transduction histidine kinase